MKDTVEDPGNDVLAVALWEARSVRRSAASASGQCKAAYERDRRTHVKVRAMKLRTLSHSGKQSTRIGYSLASPCEFALLRRRMK